MRMVWKRIETEFCIRRKKQDMSDLNENEYAIGVDMGGTNIRVALIGANGLAAPVHGVKTHAKEGSANILIRLRGTILDAFSDMPSQAEFKGIGFGAPGPLNAKTGVIFTMPNLPGWEDFPLRSYLETEFSCPVELMNDADAAGWGEFFWGAAAGCRTFVLITLGTGIGSSLFLNGAPWIGTSGISSEFGHIPISMTGPRCSCGCLGHLESYLSSEKMVQRIIQAIQNGSETCVRKELLQQDGFQVKEIIESAMKNDPLALREIWRYGRYLGRGLAVMANLLGISQVVLSGGLSNAWPLMEPIVRSEVSRNAFPQQVRDLNIQLSMLNGFGGVMGAGGYMLHQTRH